MRAPNDKPWLPYVAPFGVYMLFLLLQARFESAQLVWLYPLKTIVTAATVLYFWRSYEELPRWLGTGAPPSSNGYVRFRSLSLAILIGTIAIVIWIALDPYYPGLGRVLGQLGNLVNRVIGEPTVALSAPEVFDPETIGSAGLRWLFIGSRIFGAVVVVAFMEELFWRGFLIRWLIDEDFKRVPVGAFTWGTFGITVLFFGLEHDQWLAGLICGALYNWLYYRTKDIFACVVAHATSNALLAAWVLTRHEWRFW